MINQLKQVSQCENEFRSFLKLLMRLYCNFVYIECSAVFFRNKYFKKAANLGRDLPKTKTKHNFGSISKCNTNSVMNIRKYIFLKSLKTCKAYNALQFKISVT